MRILLVEDDTQLADAIARGPLRGRVRGRARGSYEEGRLRAVLGNLRRAFVLDVMLPGGDGFALCREIRKRGVGTPVMMLTARDHVKDRVHGLDSGADDYLTKPFAFEELVARIRALARRPRTPQPETVVIADLEVDIRAHRVTRGGKEIELTAKEFSLLEILARRRNEVLDRATISAHVWDDNHDPFTNVLEVLVRRLRRKSDDGFGVKLIHTFRGAGYRLGE